MYINYIFFLKCFIWADNKNIYDDNQFLTTDNNSFYMKPYLRILFPSSKKYMQKKKFKEICKCHKCEYKRTLLKKWVTKYRKNCSCKKCKLFKDMMSSMKKKKTVSTNGMCPRYLQLIVKINEIFSRYYSLSYICINNKEILFPKKVDNEHYYFKITSNLLEINFTFFKKQDNIPENDMQDFELNFPFLYLFAKFKN